MSPVKHNAKYVLVTAAYNEEAFIENTLRAVVCQTLLPRKWVIVSDASTDGTDDVIRKYEKDYDFIELVRIETKRSLGFASKVNALNTGLHILSTSDYDYIGNLDADVSFGPCYFANLLKQFERDDRLGLAGGFIYEERNGEFAVRFGNTVRSVAGAIQMFRRECYESVGPYLPIKHGGEDWCAEIIARMKHWHVQSFPQLKVSHHRPTGGGTGAFKYCFWQGMTEFALGSHPWFVICKSVRRLRARPYFALGACMVAGFVWAACKREERPVPRELVEYLRGEQQARLRDLARRVLIVVHRPFLPRKCQKS